MKKKLSKKIFFKKIVKVENLKNIKLTDGNVVKYLDNKSKFFKKFGEVYFSFVKQNSIKAWKLNKQNEGLLTVVIGKIKFVFFFQKNFYSITLSEKKPQLLFVPKNIWYGFQGLEKKNLISNFLANKYSEKYSFRLEIKKIKYRWKKK